MTTQHALYGGRLNTDTGDSTMMEEDLGVESGQMGKRPRTPGGFGGGSSLRVVGSIKTSLPMLKINVPLTLSTHDIFNIFTNVSQKEKFQVIEME